MPTKLELEAENKQLKEDLKGLAAREVATEVVEVPVVAGGEAAAQAAQASLVESREYGEENRRATKESHLKRRALQQKSLANPSGGR